MKLEIENLLREQLTSWELAQNNYEALKHLREREIEVGGWRYRIQFNPARIVSSSAKVDAKSIEKRSCFLCSANLPQVQRGLPFLGEYQILVNPFPIFPKHLTIPKLSHIDQSIKGHFRDMLDLAQSAAGYVVFYNGPKCGASAPDHIHFQAGNRGFLPIEEEWRQRCGDKILECDGAVMWALDDAVRSTIVIEASNRDVAVEMFNRVYDAMELKDGEVEPMMNALVWQDGDRWIVVVFARSKHRPSHYEAEGSANILISPASVDLGGVFITPREGDFEKLTAADIAAILGEVCIDADDFGRLKQRIKEQKWRSQE